MPRQSLSGSTVAGMTMVTVGSMTANIAAYLLALPALRWLGPAGYGEFASLLAAQLVLAVPALALQTVVAREVVHGKPTAALRALGYRCAAIVGVVALVLVPIMSWALDTSLGATASALVAAPLLVLLGTEQGLLQGAGRFAELSVVLAGAGIAKVAPAVAVLAVGGGPGPTLLAGAAGTGVMAFVARLIAGRRASVTDGEGGAASIGVATVLRASQVQLALIALSSMDLVIARMVLDSHDAGLYAAGAVATKAAFWLPQAIGVVLYPKMANPEHSAAAVRSALGVLTALGAVLVVGAAIAAPLAPILFGSDYAPVQGILWMFAWNGAALAVLQGALLSAIAGDRTYLAIVAWVGLAVEATLMFTVADSVRQFITVAACVATVTAATASLLAVRGARSDVPTN
ncbi:polysaccharide biosynthesis protein [Prescottella agglutinans]|uniref:O-antigen/teichoic acid export membrane protein n=1 Tax=Prescottella agglutinans TaxID=1644129 RepID=A0ABT6M9K1_9NOCA|nr:polysaccharide biosynthesis protein [Prescottella agglutinans]MDH6280446.1 O-antigen/teichoic acid export membrane protein [Prescottella agglutinans]